MASDAEQFQEHLEKITPSHEWAVRATFVQFAPERLARKEWEKRYDAPPDDIPSSSLDDVSRDELLAYKDRAEWGRQFEEKYQIPMHTYHNYFIRHMRWVAGIQKAHLGWGADRATVSRAKQEFSGMPPLPPQERGRENT